MQIRMFGSKDFEIRFSCHFYVAQTLVSYKPATH